MCPRILQAYVIGVSEKEYLSGNQWWKQFISICCDDWCNDKFVSLIKRIFIFQVEWAYRPGSNKIFVAGHDVWKLLISPRKFFRSMLHISHPPSSIDRNWILNKKRFSTLINRTCALAHHSHVLLCLPLKNHSWKSESRHENWILKIEEIRTKGVMQYSICLYLETHFSHFYRAYPMSGVYFFSRTYVVLKKVEVFVWRVMMSKTSHLISPCNWNGFQIEIVPLNLYRISLFIFSSFNWHLEWMKCSMAVLRTAKTLLQGSSPAR